LVGNAVSVPVAEWIGGHLASPGVFDARHATAIDHGAGWPKAAWGAKGRIHACAASTFPVASPPIALAAFLAYPVSPLSARATMGFIVVIDLPTASVAGNEHERIGCPSTCTVQAPHCAIPQLNLVPVSPI
jgi:hypothetical protein